MTSGVASGVEAERRGSSDPPQRAGFAERRTSRAAPRFTRCACDPPGPDRVWVGEVLRGLPARTRFVPSARSRTGGSALMKEVSRGGKRAHCEPRFRAPPLPFPMGTPNPDGRNCAPRIPPTRARRGDCLTRPSAQRSGLTRPTHQIWPCARRYGCHGRICIAPRPNQGDPWPGWRRNAGESRSVVTYS